MKTRIILFLLVLALALAASADAQVFRQWVARYGGDGADTAMAIVLDDEGFVYVTGKVHNGSNYDYVTVKYDPVTGESLWVSTYNGGGHDTPKAIDVDAGGVYVTGESWNGADYDYLTIKYSATTGSQGWTDPRIYDDGRDDEAYAIVACGGAVYVTGESRKALNDDIVTIKYGASSGYEYWEQTYNNPPYNDYATAIAVDTDCNAYVTGGSYGAHGFDYITIKYRESDGFELWKKRYNGPGAVNSWDFARDLAVCDNGVYVTGESENYLGNMDYATIRYDASDGDSLWATRHDGPVHGDDQAKALAADQDCNIWVTGTSRMSTEWAQSCIVTIKYDSEGHEICADTTCSGMPYSEEIGRDIAVDTEGNAWVTGRLQNSLWNYDYITMKYRSYDCHKIGAARYDGPADEDDDAYAVAVDTGGVGYVSGSSFGNGMDFATIKYSSVDTPVVIFRPEIDGWNFSNHKNTMWPYSWWSQFDYCADEYPDRWCESYESQDFPDWPLFAEAFGDNQCYWRKSGFGRPIYKIRAEVFWRIVVEINKSTDAFGNTNHWGGSCAGFAYSSLLYYNQYRSVFEDFPPYSILYDVPLTDSSRKVVNKYNTMFYGAEHLWKYWLLGRPGKPDETLSDLWQMLLQSGANNRALWEVNEWTALGSHALVACSLAQDELDPDIYKVFTYENNYPSEFDSIQINTATGTWEYSRWNWGGSKGLHIMDSVSRYLDYATIPPMGLHNKQGTHMGHDETDLMLIFNTGVCGIIITNLDGDSIGCVQSPKGSIVVGIENAAPIIPPVPDSSQERFPVGYVLPKGSYTARISDGRDSLLYFSVFPDTNAIFFYKRTDFQEGQTDLAEYSDNDRYILVSSSDDESKTAGLMAVSTSADREMACHLDNIDLSQDESLELAIVDHSQFSLMNAGHEREYDLTLELAARTINPIFVRDSITIPDSCLHRIFPDWDALETTALTILADCDLDGVFEDTLWVQDERRGDADGSGVIDVADIIYVINYLFKGTSPPDPLLAGEANCDGVVDVADVMYLINYLFGGTSAPGCY